MLGWNLTVDARICRACNGRVVKVPPGPAFLKNQNWGTDNLLYAELNIEGKHVLFCREETLC